MSGHAIDVYQHRSAECPASKNVHARKGGLRGEAPQTLTRSYYFEPPLSKKCSRAAAKSIHSVDDLSENPVYEGGEAVGFSLVGKRKFAFEVFLSPHIARHVAQIALIILVESGKLAPLLMTL